MSGGVLRNTAELPEPEGCWGAVPFPVTVLVSWALTTCPGGCSQRPHVPHIPSVAWGHVTLLGCKPPAGMSSGLGWKLPCTAGLGLGEGALGGSQEILWLGISLGSGRLGLELWNRVHLLSAAPALLGVEWEWQGLTWLGSPTLWLSQLSSLFLLQGLTVSSSFSCLEGSFHPPPLLLAEGSGWLPPSQGGLPCAHPLRRTSLLSPSQEDFPAVTSRYTP